MFWCKGLRLELNGFCSFASCSGLSMACWGLDFLLRDPSQLVQSSRSIINCSVLGRWTFYCQSFMSVSDTKLSYFYSTTFLMCSGNSTVVYDSPTLIRALRTIGEGSGIYFVSATVLILTAMSIERWLIVSRRSFFNRRRACFAVFALILTATPPAVLRVLENVNTVYGRALRFKLVTVMVSCYLIIMMANVKVYQSICRHQRQIQCNTTLHNFDGSAINVAKYKKSVMTMIYILLTFSVCFFPYVILTTIYFGFGNRTLESYSAFRQ